MSQIFCFQSFKSKQLVRSQAIRESTSPPRTISPAVVTDDNINKVTTNNVDNVKNNETRSNDNDASSHASDDRCSDANSCSVSEDDFKRKQPVEIQVRVKHIAFNAIFDIC